MALSHALSGGEEAQRAHRDFSAVTAEMRAYLQGLVGQRRADPRGFFRLLLSTGHETTMNLLSNALLCLLENPDPLAHLRAAPELPSAIEELLRYHSPR